MIGTDTWVSVAAYFVAVAAPAWFAWRAKDGGRP